MANKTPSIVQSGNNRYLTPSLSLNRLATDFHSAGVIGAAGNTSGVSPATGAFAVNAQGSPNMTVAVTGGVAYVTATPTGGTAQLFGVTADVSENVTIAANSSGSTVYDFIYIKLDADKLNNPAANGLDVVTYVPSRSTTAYSATGANNGNSNGAQANSLLLAVVTVVNSAASIANGSITDARRLSIVTVSPAVGTKFNVYLTAAQNVGTGATKVGFDTKNFDTGGNVDIVTNKGRFTAPVAGFYQFSANVLTTTAGTGTNLVLYLYKNGAAVVIGANAIAVAGNNPGVSTSSLLQLAAGDYIEVYCATGTAARAIDVGSSAPANTFSGFLVSLT